MDLKSVVKWDNYLDQLLGNLMVMKQVVMLVEDWDEQMVALMVVTTDILKVANLALKRVDMKVT